MWSAPGLSATSSWPDETSDLDLLYELAPGAKLGWEIEDLQDELRRDALLWNFTVLGEATAQRSEELRAAHSTVEWRRPAQLRNRIVHGYWSIDLESLVSTAHDDLPRFAEAVWRVIEAVEQTPSKQGDPRSER